MKLPAIIDTSGRPSHTLLFVALSMFAILASYAWGWHMGTPATISEFGTGVMTVLAPLVAREWVKPAGG